MAGLNQLVVETSFEKQIFSKGESSFYLNYHLFYVWGYNEDGQLGLGDKQNRSSPTVFKLPKFEKIYLVACGAEHSLCLTENNLCYVWGKNKSGELGLGHTNECLRPTLLELPNHEIFSYVACTECSSLCFTKNNLCYVWGENNWGQLGLGDNFHRIVPTIFPFCNSVIFSSIACGANHTFGITMKGEIYGWGANALGQLGIIHNNDSFEPVLVKLPNNEKPSILVCGYSHSICLMESGNVYVWGYNSNGQLGLGDDMNRFEPTSLTLPDNEKFFFVACGSSHSMYLTQNNLCYVSGENRFGELGLGDTNKRFVPTLLKVSNNERISFITCGAYYSMCLTQNNLCYVWGDNHYGQLGLGDEEDRLRPTLLKLP